MNVIKANSDNLASVLMGKHIQFPWRGQPDVVITIPYQDWIKFMQQHIGYLQFRNSLDYTKALVNEGSDVSIRYFLYDVSWALYSELAQSSNSGLDATLILPYFDNGIMKSLEDIDNAIQEMSAEDIQKCHNRLRATTRNYYNLMGATDHSFGLVDIHNLSTWNIFVFKVCLYLQYKSSNKVTTEKLNIDWRSI